MFVFPHCTHEKKVKPIIWRNTFTSQFTYQTKRYIHSHTHTHRYLMCTFVQSRSSSSLSFLAPGRLSFLFEQLSYWFQPGLISCALCTEACLSISSVWQSMCCSDDAWRKKGNSIVSADQLNTDAAALLSCVFEFLHTWLLVTSWDNVKQHTHYIRHAMHAKCTRVVCILHDITNLTAWRISTKLVYSI